MYGTWGAYACQHGQQFEVCRDRCIRSKATSETQGLVAQPFCICRPSCMTALRPLDYNFQAIFKHLSMCCSPHCKQCQIWLLSFSCQQAKLCCLALLLHNGFHNISSAMWCMYRGCGTVGAVFRKLDDGNAMSQQECRHASDTGTDWRMLVRVSPAYKSRRGKSSSLENSMAFCLLPNPTTTTCNARLSNNNELIQCL